MFSLDRRPGVITKDTIVRVVQEEKAFRFNSEMWRIRDLRSERKTAIWQLPRSTQPEESHYIREIDEQIAALSRDTADLFYELQGTPFASRTQTVLRRYRASTAPLI